MKRKKIKKMLEMSLTKEIFKIILILYIFLSLPYVMAGSGGFGIVIMIITVLSISFLIHNEEMKKRVKFDNLECGSLIRYQCYIGTICEIKADSFIVKTGDNHFEVTKSLCTVWEGKND